MSELLISVSKELFHDILNLKTRIFTRKANKYWKNELLDISVKDDKLRYDLKKIDYLKLTNGLGKEKPYLKVECNALAYDTKLNHFEFKLGKIIEQKNLPINEDYKDNLIEQLLKEKEMLKDMINKDTLTTLYNRKKMFEDLDKFSAQMHANYLCAVFIDADRFKGINDNFGHDTGDRVLKFLALTIKDFTEKNLNGEVYRYGGEEFVILCFERRDTLLEKLETLREEVRNHKIFHPKKDISITISLGVAFNDNINHKDKLLKLADEMVLKAKKNGRDRIELGN